MPFSPTTTALPASVRGPVLFVASRGSLQFVLRSSCRSFAEYHDGTMSRPPVK